MTSPPEVFLPYQQRVCRDKSQVRIIEKSRRIGISWAIAGGDAVPEAASPRGWNVWYLGYNKEMGQQFIHDAADFARAYQFVSSDIQESMFDDTDGDGEKSILMYTIRFASGYGIHSLTSHPRNLRSRDGHAILDEAAYHHDLRGVLKAALAFRTWGRGRITIISSHNGVDNPFNELCEDVRKGKRNFSIHRITFDEACSEGLYDRICLRNRQQPTQDGYEQWYRRMVEDYAEDAAEELHCVPARSGGTYIPQSLVESRMEPGQVVQYRCDDNFVHLSDEQRGRDAKEWCDAVLAPLLASLPVDREHCFGLDFGRVSDLSVFAPLTLEQDLKRRCRWLAELRNVPFQQQEEILTYAIDRLPSFTHGAMDSGGNGAFLAERAQQRYGASRIEAVTLSETWYAEQLPRLKASFEDGTIAVVQDADVLRDMSVFQKINGIPKPAKLKTVEKRDDGKERHAYRHGDAALAILLGHYASRAGVSFVFR